MNLLLEDYRTFLTRLNLSRLRIASIFAITLVPASSSLDLLTNSNYFMQFLKIRILCALISSLILAASFFNFLEKYSIYLGILLTWCVGSTISMMIYILGFETPYYAGLNLIILVIGVLFPWGMMHTIIACLGIYATYLIPSLIQFDLINDIRVYLNNNVFIIETIIIAIASNYFSTRMRFHEFRSRYDLNNAKQDLESSYKKLQELDQAKSEFFANVSHELRTPLTMILAPMETLIKGKANIKKSVQDGYMAMIYNNALRLLKLINNLLDLAKVDAGKMKIFLAEADLQQFIKGIVASVAPLAEKKQIKVECRLSEDLPSTMIDRDKLEKVILNMIFNSIKFTESGGIITLSCEYQNQTFTFCVEDNGIGIGEEYLPHIFERFTQADASATRKYEGTGIGLSIVKEFVELHEGKVWVESELGKGTKIFFTLPRISSMDQIEAKPDKRAGFVEVDEKKREMDWTKELQKQALYHDDMNGEKQQEAEEDGAEKLKLLLVDDNPDMINFLTFQLQDDYIVYNARDGEEGIQTAKAKRPDIIISDVMMPIKDGYQLCKELKAYKKTQHIPIILLTAKTDLSKKIEGLERGADEYLTKPFSSEEVRARVKTLLNARSMERDIQNRNDILSKTLKELKEAEGQLVHSAKMASIGQLAAGVAHEINNPLTSVMSSLSTLGRLQARMEAGEIDQDKYCKDMRTLFERIDTGMKRTKVIIDDLMNFARKDVEGLKAEDLNQGLRSVLTLIEHRKTDDIQIHLDLGETPKVECVLGQINQVLMNILLNAMDAIKGKGDVWISTSKQNDQVELVIKDNGIGIPKDIQQRIFEPFFTTKDVGKGTGLGLSISHKIIENHHGTIRCESSNGSGAAFVIRLPFVQPRVQEMSLS